ncbi:MAG: PRC-barrel domain-containing protein [Neisseriaceae bacterium]
MENYLKSNERSGKTIGKKVIGNENKIVGKIEELAINMHTGVVCYAVVSFEDSSCGFKEDFYVIPWKILEYHPVNDIFMIRFSQSLLKTASGFRFNPDKWPDFTDYTWLKSIDNFYDSFGHNFINSESPS